MHVALSLLLTFGCLFASGQPVVLLSRHETGIYKHALDSIITLIQKDRTLAVIYISALECVLNYLPDTIQNVAIVTDKKKVRKKKGNLKPDEFLLTVACSEAVNDEIVVSIFVQEPEKWTFAFGYEINPTTKEAKLIFVHKGRSLSVVL